jgi:hypothetical protein
MATDSRALASPNRAQSMSFGVVAEVALYLSPRPLECLQRHRHQLTRPYIGPTPYGQQSFVEPRKRLVGYVLHVMHDKFHVSVVVEHG